MQKIALEKQYDGQVEKYEKNISEYNKESRELFLSLLPDIGNKKLLDLACGDGSDCITYSILGAEVTGLDSSKEMIEIAKQKAPSTKFVEGKMESIPLKEQFDVITCKYAIQTSKDIAEIYRQINNILKPDGVLLILATHPLRQFMEKKNKSKDYFKKDIVKSTIFEDKLTLHEPSHTFNEFFSPYFLKNFDVLHFLEREEFPGAKRIEGYNYPCYFILKAIKRGERK